MANPQLDGYHTKNGATLITNIWKKKEEIIVLTREKEVEKLKRIQKLLE